MKQKLLITIGFLAMLIIGLIPTDVFAASASVYVSPGSSSVTVGGYVTVAVRVNSGTSPMDSVQASLNFNGSLLQYSSYSGGSFTTFQQGLSGSTFTYVGALMGSSTTSDKQMFSVTFKAIASGTASLSISGAGVAYSGTAFSVSTSGGSVAVSAPASSTPPPVTTTPPPATKTSTPTTSATKTTTTSTTQTTAAATSTADTTAPKLVAKPTVTVGLNTIKLKFNTDEKSKIQTIYTLGKTAKTLNNDSFVTSQSIIIGDSQPLIAGTTYNIQVIAIDGSGNKATIYTKNIKTTGINYTVQITDTDGKPLANYPVQIFSDPISATTDASGNVTFKNMTPGEHTLVFVVDGLTLRQPVTVAQQTVDGKLSPTATDTKDTVKLPIKFAETIASKPVMNNYLLFTAITIFIIGALVVFFVLKFKRFRHIFDRIWNKFNKPKKESIFNKPISPPPLHNTSSVDEPSKIEHLQADNINPA